MIGIGRLTIYAMIIDMVGVPTVLYNHRRGTQVATCGNVALVCPMRTCGSEVRKTQSDSAKGL